MVKKILLGLVGLGVVFAVVVASRPGAFRVERSLTMAAPPAVPYAMVQDFRQWGRWSPYDKLDADMARTYSGAAAGLGAEYHWVGDNAGEGRMRITDARPNEAIVIQLDFIKPMTASNTATFEFVPDGAGTKVTWRMEGENGFLGKAFCMFIDMDRMVGDDFHKGLTTMKAEAEAQAANPPVLAGRP